MGHSQNSFASIHEALIFVLNFSVSVPQFRPKYYPATRQSRLYSVLGSRARLAPRRCAAAVRRGQWHARITRTNLARSIHIAIRT
eukprot:COSAG02_NODE_1589_length_11792_cov_203.500898_1_plen_85_part_00